MIAPLVSIVIPCFNAGAMVERCLRSALAQTHPRLEIIVVDNNSSDDSIARVERLARGAASPISVIRCVEQGVTYARNTGIDLANGEYLQLLDADDGLGSQKIARQVAALQRDREFDIAYGDWEWCLRDNSGQELRVGLRSAQFDDYLLQLLVDNWVPPHAYLLRRAALASAPPLPHFFTATRCSEDREYFTLAALSGLRFLYVADAPVQYNSWSGTQMTRAIPTQVRADALAQIFSRLRDYAGRAPPPALHDLHQQLLDQRWECWQMTASRGTEEGLDVVAAFIAAVLRRVTEPNTLEHYARVVARMLCLDTAARLARDGAPVSLQRLRSAMSARLVSESDVHQIGVEVRLPSIPDQAIVASTVAIGDLLARGPLYLPIFAEQRVLILRHLHELCRRGLLVRTNSPRQQSDRGARS